jgi:3-hydroxybutyryl-CoA dehydrogenase
MATSDKSTCIAVIGNGIIGHAVAEVFASAGHPVVMIGRSLESLGRAMTNIETSLNEFAANDLLDAGQLPGILARIETSTEMADAARAGLVVEAVTEDVPLKLDLFEKLDGICPPETILASSSGHPASELVERVRHRDRVIATHFWYPPQLFPMLEVCAGPETSPEVLERTCTLLRGAGKEPVIIEKEVPGFLFNRIQFAALREAWSLWASGAASAEAIDAVVRNGLGRRYTITGPIESADVGGLDTLYAFAQSLQPDLDTRPQPPEEVGALVQAGHRGLASGRGIYDWSKRDGAALLADRRAELFRWLKSDQQKIT